MTKFKNPDQQYIYQLFMNNLQDTNLRSKSMYMLFNYGLIGADAGVERTDPGYPAWAAGRDIRKARLSKITTGGIWIHYGDFNGTINGWVEAFPDNMGRLYTVPGASRHVFVREKTND